MQPFSVYLVDIPVRQARRVVVNADLFNVFPTEGQRRDDRSCCERRDANGMFSGRCCPLGEKCCTLNGGAFCCDLEYFDCESIATMMV